MIHRTAKGMLLAAVVGTLLLGTVGCGQLAAHGEPGDLVQTKW